MTRTRKLTLSMKEFSHLVSESLDIANATPQSLVDNIAVFSDLSPKHHRRGSSFQRIFSRPTPTPGRREDPVQGCPENLSDEPRKMIGWPFSRSTRKNQPIKEDLDPPTHGVDDPDGLSHACSISSLATMSTSSLGSIIPVHERLFQVTSGDGGPSRHCHVANGQSAREASPVLTTLPPAKSNPASPLDTDLGNGSTTSALSSSLIAGSSSQGSTVRASCEGTETSRSVAVSEPGSYDEDPTPRALTFGSVTCLSEDDASLTQRGRPYGLSLVVPSRNVEILSLRPAVGVAPHVPSETESSVSLYSTSSPTSPVARSSSPTFTLTKPPESENAQPVPPNVFISAPFPAIASPSHIESVPPPMGPSSRQRKRAMTRSVTPPPSPRPPPTGPLPAIPSSVPPVPPVPPLPSLFSKMGMNATHPAISSPSRPAIAGTSTNSGTALPPSPPGGLRLPSRLSWVNSVRAVLPSPPASPTKSPVSSASKAPLPHSPSKTEIKQPNELKRPTSIGVIEAADNVQVRRTKSILLLGSRSKSNTSLSTKRVQIHADANVETTPSPKPRRKSSAATVGHSAIPLGPMITPAPSSELLVPRERRHSAPVLSSMDAKAPGTSADWTLSLPFCTDVPGEKIVPSPLLTPQLESKDGLEEVQSEDWTLCMPLRVRVGTPTGEVVEQEGSTCTHADTEETAETRPTVQLPTPSPSPTLPSPASVVLPLDPEEDEVLVEERPASPQSLGPHVGGLDLAGGCGKRASGWHVYGWFDEVDIPEEERDVVSPTPTVVSECKFVKSHVSVFRRTHEGAGRHPSQDSMSTVSTSGATFYSARSSLLVN